MVSPFFSLRYHIYSHTPSAPERLPEEPENPRLGVNGGLSLNGGVNDDQRTRGIQVS